LNLLFNNLIQILFFNFTEFIFPFYSNEQIYHLIDKT